MSMPYVTPAEVSRMISLELKNKGVSESPINYWKDTNTYFINSLVVYEGDLYKSLVNSNIGHNPTENTYWVKLEHIIEYTNSLPVANEKSVSFVDINGQLYYKTTNGTNYLYKQVSSGSGPTPGPTDNYLRFWSSAVTYNYNDYVFCNGKIYISKVSDNINHLPPFDENEYWSVCATSFKNASADETIVPESNCVYLVKGHTTYSDKRRCNFKSEATAIGWRIEECGITNHNMQTFYDWSQIGEHYGELMPYIEEVEDGLLSMAIDDKGVRHFKYNEDFTDDYTFELCFYDTDFNKVILFTNKSTTYNQFIISTDDTTVPDGIDVAVPDLTNEEVYKLAEAFSKYYDCIVEDTENKKQYKVVQSTLRTNYYSITILMLINNVNYIVNYVYDDANFSIKVVDMPNDYITLYGSSSGSLSEDDIRYIKTHRNVVLKWSEGSGDDVHFFRKMKINDTEESVVYGDDYFTCTIDLLLESYEVTPKQLETDMVIVHTAMTGIGTNTFRIPEITKGIIFDIKEAFDSDKVVKLVVDSTHQYYPLSFVEENNSYILQLLIYEKILHKDVIVRYDYNRSTFEIKHTIDPLTTAMIICDGDIGDSGTLSDRYIQVFDLVDLDKITIQVKTSTESSVITRHLRFAQKAGNAMVFENHNVKCVINTDTYNYHIANNS